jgi:hypothetical protein
VVTWDREVGSLRLQIPDKTNFHTPSRHTPKHIFTSRHNLRQLFRFPRAHPRAQRAIFCDTYTTHRLSCKVPWLSILSQTSRPHPHTHAHCHARPSSSPLLSSSSSLRPLLSSSSLLTGGVPPAQPNLTCTAGAAPTAVRQGNTAVTAGWRG